MGIKTYSSRSTTSFDCIKQFEKTFHFRGKVWLWKNISAFTFIRHKFSLCIPISDYSSWVDIDNGQDLSARSQIRDPDLK